MPFENKSYVQSINKTVTLIETLFSRQRNNEKLLKLPTIESPIKKPGDKFITHKETKRDTIENYCDERDNFMHGLAKE